MVILLCCYSVMKVTLILFTNINAKPVIQDRWNEVVCTGYLLPISLLVMDGLGVAI